MTAKINSAILLFIILIIAGCGTNNVTDDYKNAIIEENPEKLVELLSNEEVEITTEEAEAHIDLINSEFNETELEEEMSRISEHLDSSEKDTNTYLSGNGGYYTLFVKENDSKFVTAQKSEVMTDLGDAVFQFEIGGEIVETGNGNSDYVKIYDLIPGIYSLDGTGIINNEEFDMTIDVDFRNEGDERASVTDDMLIVLVSQHFPKDIQNIKYFIDNQEITELNYNENNFGPIDGSNSFDIYATGVLEEQDVTTNIINIPAKSDTRKVNAKLNFNMDEVESIRQAVRDEKQAVKDEERKSSSSQRVIENFYNDRLQDALNMSGHSLQISLIDYMFKDEKVPEVISSMLNEANGHKYIIEVSDISLLDEDKGKQNLVYNVTFNVSNNGNEEQVEQIVNIMTENDSNFIITDISSE